MTRGIPPAWTAALEHIHGAHLCASERCGCGSLVFTCPTCQRTSHHPEDARNGWCSACATFSGYKQLLA